MSKAGTDYQELVAEVVRALDSNATVKTGQLVRGPDGGREVDVEVQGTQDGKRFFILIECKDKTYGRSRRRVSIEEIDALDSKRKDLSADLTVLCSNTGFAAGALQKQVVSALSLSRHSHATMDEQNSSWSEIWWQKGFPWIRGHSHSSW